MSFKILLVTDTHYHPEDSNWPEFGGADHVNVFGSQVKDHAPMLKEKFKHCDLVVHLGDLIQEKQNSEEDLGLYQDIVQAFEGDVDIKFVVGNHDAHNLSYADLADQFGQSKTYYAFEKGGLLHVVLNTNRPGLLPRGQELPTVDAEQLNWLKETLASATGKVIVYSHLPLAPQDLSGNYYFKDLAHKAFPSNRAEVLSVLEESGKVLAVFSGHLHFLHEQTLNGILHVTVPSFSENDGSHKPKLEYMVATVEEGSVTAELFSLER